MPGTPRRSREGGNLARESPGRLHENPAHPEPVEGHPRKWESLPQPQTRRSRVGGNLDP